jgi:hypothetical protein
VNDLVHPYQGAYDYKWHQDFNGNLTSEEVAQREKEWVFYVDTRHPLTADIYREMSDDQKGRHRRPRIFASVGGLEVVSRGQAKKAFSDIHKKWSAIAADRAKEKRKEAGWHGWNYLRSPTGATTGANGQRFGPYTLPNDEFDKGMWDGILTNTMTFTV